VEERSESKGEVMSGAWRRKMLEVWRRTHLKGSYSLRERAPVTLAFMNQVRMLQRMSRYADETVQGNTYGSNTATVKVAMIAANAGKTNFSESVRVLKINKVRSYQFSDGRKSSPSTSAPSLPSDTAPLTLSAPDPSLFLHQ